MDDKDSESQMSDQHEPQDYHTSDKELDEKYPNRPHNHSQTLPFHVLFKELFNPLNENLKKPSGPATNRRKLGPHAGRSTNPHDIRKAIIERFISRWRNEVGDDIYPAFRLIIPEKDRERPMYGLKEKALGRSLVKIMKIDKNSEDAFSLINWKTPGQNASTYMAGDFPGRCYEVLSRRPFRVEVGDMTIEEVNNELDKLSAASKDEEQVAILDQFYRRMNAEELMWLIRIILRSMKVGATERTFFNSWHPDSEALFNVSSSLRRVCWELYDPHIRLETEERGVTLMQCYQPQLAIYNPIPFAQMIGRMKPTEDDNEFWIEEKLDGERMQLHMRENNEMPGGREFRFFSRKAKDYTYLYGANLVDEGSALTSHLKDAFASGVENIILDGEMITWDPDQKVMVAFGSLKTAAISEQRNPHARGTRPLYRVFDILYLNDQVLTRYTLRDRRKALEASVQPVSERLEILECTVATSAEEIEERLRDVIENASEGLVIKNPRSAYHLNMRNDDWMKIKPEYMAEFGESLDCLIIGGYYGSGHRGGRLSSFLCGLRDDKVKSDKPTEKFLSFFKVGGGMTGSDYAYIRHVTDGKWMPWDAKRPPSEYIELGGGSRQFERPDMWIKPRDSLVVEVKAATITSSDEFAVGSTLRFPRFKRRRDDKNWETALSHEELMDLKASAEDEHRKNMEQKKIAMTANKKRKLNAPRVRRDLKVAGYNTEAGIKVGSGSESDVFDGLTFFVITESTIPEKKSKIQLEEIIKVNGGQIVQSPDAADDVVCIAERRTVKVASLVKRGHKEIVRPVWIFDCIRQAKIDFAKGLFNIVLPLEVDRHMFFTPEDKEDAYDTSVDQFGDSYARDLAIDQLAELMEKMEPTLVKASSSLPSTILDPADCLGAMFAGLKFYFQFDHAISNGSTTDIYSEGDVPPPERRVLAAKIAARFVGATVSDSLSDQDVTHIIVGSTTDVKQIRKNISGRRKLPRIVTVEWIEESWRQSTRLDEERFAAT